MHETRPRRDPSALAEARHEEPLDDWLGDVSDDDWDDQSRGRAGGRRAAPVYEEPPRRAETVWAQPTAESQARPVAAAEGHRAIIERRRHVAGLAVAVLLALAAAILVLLLRGGDQATTSVSDLPNTTPTETTPSPPPSTPPPSASTPSPTPPPTADESAFTLPEGTKLRRGEESDPVVIEELQQALSAAGYDPGPVDGKYGRRTEAAVAAFQEANDLSVDGVVGPETAAALNDALADG